jgi:hypothetical protein
VDSSGSWQWQYLDLVNTVKKLYVSKSVGCFWTGEGVTGFSNLSYNMASVKKFLLMGERQISTEDCFWNVMAHTQKPDFVFRWKGRVLLNRRGRQFSRLPTAEVCAPALVMLDTPCSEVVWRVPTTHSIRQFSLHFPSRASPCAITFQLDSKRHWGGRRWSASVPLSDYRFTTQTDRQTTGQQGPVS